LVLTFKIAQKYRVSYLWPSRSAQQKRLKPLPPRVKITSNPGTYTVDRIVDGTQDGAPLETILTQACAHPETA